MSMELNRYSSGASYATSPGFMAISHKIDWESAVRNVTVARHPKLQSFNCQYRLRCLSQFQDRVSPSMKGRFDMPIATIELISADEADVLEALARAGIAPWPQDEDDMLAFFRSMTEVMRERYVTALG